VAQVLEMYDVIVLWVKRVEDFHTVVSLVLLERRLFLVILHDNSETGSGLFCCISTLV